METGSKSFLESKKKEQMIQTPEEQVFDDKLAAMPDEEFLSYMLDGVSRTFALTIPQLPDKLHKTVADAYLLCRTVDTIEDEPELSYDQKRSLCQHYSQVLKGDTEAESFVREIMPLLSESTIPAEHELIQNTRKVIDIAHSFSKEDQEALIRCVDIMGEGMVFYQENASLEGLEDQEEMDKYCYYVAGVVGEMLTDLFCNYSEEIAQNRERMSKLAVSFGEGLQMTNILKDIWTDYDRGVCWLPKSVFKRFGFDLKNLSQGPRSAGFQKGLQHLVSVAHAHLVNAFEYTLLIPPQEKGIRKFCLWALGMAILTLRKIYKKPDFTHGDEVKIKRNTVKSVILISNVTAGNDMLLRMLFKGIRAGLPICEKEIIK